MFNHCVIMEQVISEWICDLWPCVWPVAVHERGPGPALQLVRSHQPGSVQCHSATARDRSYHSETASTPPQLDQNTCAHTQTHTHLSDDFLTLQAFPQLNNSTVSFKSFNSFSSKCGVFAPEMHWYHSPVNQERERAHASIQYQRQFISLSTNMLELMLHSSKDLNDSLTETVTLSDKLQCNKACRS